MILSVWQIIFIKQFKPIESYLKNFEAVKNGFSSCLPLLLMQKQLSRKKVLFEFKNNVKNVTFNTIGAAYYDHR